MLKINRIVVKSICASLNLKNLLLIVIASSFIGASFFVIKFGPVHLFLFRITLILFVLCFLMAIMIKRGNFTLNFQVGTYIIFLVLWFVYALVSCFWASSASNAFLNISILFCNISIVIFIVTCFTELRDLKKFYSVWILMLLVSITLGLWNYKTGVHLSSSSLINAPEYKRYVPTAFYYNQNDFGTYLAICIPFVISYARYNINCLRKGLGIILLLFSLFLLLATKSRANLIGLLIGLLFWYFLILNFRDKYKVALLITIVLIASLLLTTYFNYPSDMVQNSINSLKYLTSETKDSSTVTRINLIKNSFIFLVDSYGFGVGAGNAERYMNNYAQVDVGKIASVHNWWIEIMANYGLLIFLCYIWFYMSLCLSLYLAFWETKCREERMICEPLLVGLVIFIFGSFSPSSVMAFTPQWLLIGFALAFLNYFRTDRKASMIKERDLDGCAF